jgi:phospholipase C
MKMLLALAGLAMVPAMARADEVPVERIGHIIVISLENHSFDNLFGRFPGADGQAQAGQAAVQTDGAGATYAHLPVVMDTRAVPPVADARFPAGLANAPFPIEAYVPASDKTGDLIHRFYQQQAQIHHGRMDRFAAISNAGGLTMGYYDGSKTALWGYALKYTLADHFFHAAFGGSFLNHFWLVCACTPRFDAAPVAMRAVVDADGQMRADGTVTPDGYAVNTLFSTQSPHPDGMDAAQLLPAQDMPTIGDRLSEKGVSWAWYSGGWDDAAAGHPAATFQFHHQPLAYFRHFAEGSDARKEHLKDEADFLKAVKAGTLPQVAFYKPLGEFSLHPGYADVASGDAHIATILQAIEASPLWKDSVVIVTFDENGGYWDHVAPPTVDRWGPGVRVPTLIVSPFARRGFIDHTVYDTSSILRLIETRYRLPPLTSRDAQASDLMQSLEFKAGE